MDIKLSNNWTTNNNGFPLNDAEINRYISVTPSKRQLKHAKKPFYAFIHFGMNTSTGREWGNGNETVDDFTISHINTKQWIDTIKSSGATGIILTCKHHDGFCLWDSKYTDFKITNTVYGKDLVKDLSTHCKESGLDFGVYLSPWDMHEKTYATPEYNSFFINQLTELLSNYGEIFEVWFDGAKGAEAKAFNYDWEAYYSTIRTLQPNASIAICGPDIRWIGNEAGKTRNSEFCVVPRSLTMAETVQKNSQHAEMDAYALQAIKSTDEDLGSREILEKESELCWYPAEVDVSIRKGWFHRTTENETVKTVDTLFNIYLNSVGNNCSLLLNIPPSKDGLIDTPDAIVLRELGKRINDITKSPMLITNPGKLTETDGFIEFSFDGTKSIKYCIIKEDITKSQRIELFDLYYINSNGKYEKVYSGTVAGQRKIIPVDKTTDKIILIIRQSRSTPYLSEVSFYE